jgi:anti-sigma factor RsiW
MSLLDRFRRRRHDLACRQAVSLMAAYLDGALSDPERERLEHHLAGCPHCAEYLAQIRSTVDALGRIEPEDLSDEAVEDLVALYRTWRAD